jgi:hypothetical protein
MSTPAEKSSEKSSEKSTPAENAIDNVNNPKIEKEKKFAKTWDKTFNCDDNMDAHNKKALKVMKNEGMDAAIKHMSTDQQTGRKLSYGEMRMRYG